MADVVNAQKNGHRIRTLHTACIWWSFVALGWSAGLIGPTFPDLTLIINKDLSTASWLFTVISFGFLVGAVGSGLIYDRYNKLAVLTVSALGLALSTAAIPWCSDFPAMLTLEFLFGLFSAGLDTGGTADILYIWEDEASPYMQSVHFAFSLGAILAPLVANPFLAEGTCIENPSPALSISDTAPYGMAITGTSNSTVYEEAPVFLNVSEYTNCTLAYAETKIHYSYLISACITVSAVVLYVVHYIHHSDVYTYKVSQTMEKSIIIEEGCDKSLMESCPASLDGTKTREDVGNSLTERCEQDLDFNVTTSNDHKCTDNSQTESAICSGEELEHLTEPDARTNTIHADADATEMEAIPTDSLMQHNKPNEDRHRKDISLFLKIVFVALLSLLLSLYIILEKLFVGYLMTFSINYLDWSKSDGANATATFWILFAFGRLTGIFIVRYVSETKLLILHFCILFLSILGIWPSAAYHVTVLIWVCTALSGFGMSIMFASVFSWMSQNVLVVSGKIVSVLMVSLSVSSMVFPIVLGHLMEVHSAMWFVYMLFIVACLTCVCFSVIYALYRLYLCD